MAIIDAAHPVQDVRRSPFAVAGGGVCTLAARWRRPGFLPFLTFFHKCEPSFCVNHAGDNTLFSRYVHSRLISIINTSSEIHALRSANCAPICRSGVRGCLAFKLSKTLGVRTIMSLQDMIGSFPQTQRPRSSIRGLRGSNGWCCRRDYRHSASLFVVPRDCTLER